MYSMSPQLCNKCKHLFPSFLTFQAWNFRAENWAYSGRQEARIRSTTLGFSRHDGLESGARMTARLRSDRGDYHLRASNAIDTRGSDTGNFCVPSKQEISDKRESRCRRTNPLLSSSTLLSVYIGKEKRENQRKSRRETERGIVHKQRNIRRAIKVERCDMIGKQWEYLWMMHLLEKHLRYVHAQVETLRFFPNVSFFHSVFTYGAWHP